MSSGARNRTAGATRPLSIKNTDARCVAALVGRPLDGYLPVAAPPTQQGFIGGRTTARNIVLLDVVARIESLRASGPMRALPRDWLVARRSDVPGSPDGLDSPPWDAPRSLSAVPLRRPASCRRCVSHPAPVPRGHLLAAVRHSRAVSAGGLPGARLGLARDAPPARPPPTALHSRPSRNNRLVAHRPQSAPPAHRSAARDGSTSDAVSAMIEVGHPPLCVRRQGALSRRPASDTAAWTQAGHCLQPPTRDWRPSTALEMARYTAALWWTHRQRATTLSSLA